MKFIVLGFLSFFILFSCKDKPEPSSNSNVILATSIESKKEEFPKNINKETISNKIVSKDKNPFWSGLQNALQISNEQLEMCKNIHNESIKSRKVIDDKDSNKITSWRKERNEKYRKVLGVKKYRQKVKYEMNSKK